MTQYSVRYQTRRGLGYGTMVITDRETGEDIAEYRLTPGCAAAEIAGMRRALDRHLATPGATLGNYQW